VKYIKGHLKNNLERWIGKKWYHQRFDGAPFFIQFIAECEIETHKERKLGGEFTVHFCFFENGKADWYIDIDDIKKVYTAVIKAGKKNPKISEDFIKTWQLDKDRFYKKCLDIRKMDLSKLSDDELLKLHDGFAKMVVEMNSSSSLIDGFALGTDVMIADQIREVYEKSQVSNTMRGTEVFSILTAPVHLSFINGAEVDLLKFAAKIISMRQMFITMDDYTIIEKLKKLGKYKLLEQHQKDYFWTRNNYVSDHVLSVEHFIDELRKIFKANVNVKKEVERMGATPDVNRKNKAELMKKLDLSDELKLLIKISEDFTYWQDERKKSTFWVTHYFSLILAEIGKRVDVDIELLKYMYYLETKKVLSGELTAKVLEQRKQNCVYYTDTDGMDCVHGPKADDVKQALLGSKDMSDVDDFRGLTACLGKAEGRVKVLMSATESYKIKKGDVLVAVMTRPDYVPAMKKAAAIVTDEGGVTCHAAIVSRELNIPCVIGTKIATSVLKDGDIVEVNANHAVVRILERK